MKMKLLNFCNKVIEYSFYGLFFLTPLVLTSSTSELFEFNKLWLTFGLTIVITGAWICKMILNKQFRFQKTPLDIPIFLFLLSQIISTFHSWDVHTSLWGYYSRFNGGLLSTIDYIVLYYAFVSNFSNTGAGSIQNFLRSHFEHSTQNFKFENKQRDDNKKQPNNNNQSRTAEQENFCVRPAHQNIVKNSLIVTLFSGLVVALWGLPSHFGYDPTCLLFRGSFDVSCWTAAFQPKVRIFSTLGQPDWLAAYLSILIPTALAFAFQKTQNTQQTNKSDNLKVGTSDFLKFRVFRVFWILVAVLFYIDLLYTRSRSGFIAIWIALIVFFGSILWKKKYTIRYFLYSLVIFLAITFFIGTPISQLNTFTFNGITQHFSKSQLTQTANRKPQVPVGELGGTDSSKIRLIVWKGAFDVWKHYPLFGTGVETFAFSYYKYRPAEHNLTSEWDYLYNKAHNEYLNYLATTGAFGLGMYVLMIGTFLFLFCHAEFISASRFRNKFAVTKTEVGDDAEKIVSLGLLAGYVSILITNFFGFSVVITNIYLYLIPAFVFILCGMIDTKKSYLVSLPGSKIFKSVAIPIVLFTIYYLLFTIFSYWQADKAYAKSMYYEAAAQYYQAFTSLAQATSNWPDEPTYQSELSSEEAIIAIALSKKNVSSASAELANQAIRISDTVVGQHPNNVVFWKTRARMFSYLSQIDPKQYQPAIDSLVRAHDLAPTDVRILSSLGVLYQQTGDLSRAQKTLTLATRLKPDYQEAYYALAVVQHQQALDKNDKIVNTDYQKKAVENRGANSN